MRGAKDLKFVPKMFISAKNENREKQFICMDTFQ